MKGAIETAIGIIMLAVMSVLGASYINVSLNTQRAQNYHTAVVNEIENSDFSDEVIQSAKQKAKENGYGELKIDKKVNTTTGNVYAKVVLPYKFSIPVLGIRSDHVIVGYAE